MCLGSRKARGECWHPVINSACQEEQTPGNLHIYLSYKPPAGVFWQGGRLIKNVSHLFVWESKMKYDEGGWFHLVFFLIGFPVSTVGDCSAKLICNVRLLLLGLNVKLALNNKP